MEGYLDWTQCEWHQYISHMRVTHSIGSELYAITGSSKFWGIISRGTLSPLLLVWIPEYFEQYSGLQAQLVSIRVRMTLSLQPQDSRLSSIAHRNFAKARWCPGRALRLLLSRAIQDSTARLPLVLAEHGSAFRRAFYDWESGPLISLRHCSIEEL